MTRIPLAILSSQSARGCCEFSCLFLAFRYLIAFARCEQDVVIKLIGSGQEETGSAASRNQEQRGAWSRRVLNNEIRVK
jgi:hypothetical protein